MRKIIWISGTAATIIALTGAGLYFRRQIGLLLDFCYKITDFNVIYFNNTGISFSLKLNVRNQSNIIINVSKYNFNIFLNRIQLATVTGTIQQALYNDSVSPFLLNISVKWKDLSIPLTEIIQLVAYYLTNKNKLIFKITGALSVKAFYIPVKDHNVTMQYTLAELLTPNASLSTCKI